MYWQTETTNHVSDLLHAGDLYVQAQSLFNDEMYLRLMAVMHLMYKSSMNPTDYDNELVCL